MKEFAKMGDRVIPSPQGVDYELNCDHVYEMQYDPYSGEIYLVERDPIKDQVLYFTQDDKKFINCVLNHVSRSEKTTGVLLCGLKGSGKTAMAKHIAKKSGMPVLIGNPCIRINRLKEFCAKIHQGVCIIFDEFEKEWDSSEVLTLLDGVQDGCKRLVLMTCNDKKVLSDYLFDRCSRIRYQREFYGVGEDIVNKLVTSVCGKEDKELANFIFSKFKVLSYDNIMSFLDELNHSNDSKEDILKFMNIALKNE